LFGIPVKGYVRRLCHQYGMLVINQRIGVTQIQPKTSFPIKVKIDHRSNI
jgi:hypothetical protein